MTESRATFSLFNDAETKLMRMRHVYQLHELIDTMMYKILCNLAYLKICSPYKHITHRIKNSEIRLRQSNVTL